MVFRAGYKYSNVVPTTTVQSCSLQWSQPNITIHSVSAIHCRQLTPAPLEFGLSPQAAHTPYQYQSIATGAIPQFSQSPHVPSLPTPDPDYTNQASSTLPVHDVHQVPSTSHHGENPGLPLSAVPVGCPAPLPLRNVGKEGSLWIPVRYRREC